MFKIFLFLEDFISLELFKIKSLPICFDNQYIKVKRKKNGALIIQNSTPDLFI